jgi:hypothetical protein
MQKEEDDKIRKKLGGAGGGLPAIEASVKDKYIRNYHAHPWFGPLNPHQWLVLSAIHQVVRGRQLRKISESNA